MVNKIKLHINDNEKKNMNEDVNNIKIVKANSIEVKKVCAKLCDVYADVLEELAK